MLATQIRTPWLVGNTLWAVPALATVPYARVRDEVSEGPSGRRCTAVVLGNIFKSPGGAIGRSVQLSKQHIEIQYH